MTQAPDSTTRVLVLAPTGRDAVAAADQLGAAGLNAVLCADLIELIGKLDEGAGVAVIAEEALRTHFPDLKTWVSKQLSWSDFPFVVLTSSRIYQREDAHRVHLLQS